MTKLLIAVIGLGRLGRACAEALIDDGELGLAGVVRRPDAPGTLPGRLQRFPVASHVRELAGASAALVCVPADAVLGVAWCWTAVAVPPTARMRACCWSRASSTPLSRPAPCSTPCAGSPACVGVRTATHWDSERHSGPR